MKKHENKKNSEKIKKTIKSKKRREDLELDERLENTFPASDGTAQY